LYLRKRYKNTKVLADLTWFYANNDHHGYELCRIFAGAKGSSFSLEEASKTEIFKVTGLIPNLMKPYDTITSVTELKKKKCFSRSSSQRFERFRRYPNRLLREIYKKKQQENLIDELSGNVSNKDIVRPDGSVYNELYELVSALDEAKDHYITGFFRDEKYYVPVLDELKRIFVFPALDEKNESIADRIRSEESVSIHVRRGDYLTLYNGQFKILSRDYYEAAVGELSLHTGKSIEELSFYIFSDDPDFAKKEFDWLPKKTVISDNKGDESYKDMQLMSLCKHNIIANSTFSEWAALLNGNEGHITIYPGDYMENGDNNRKSLEDWIKI
ncbi:MAG: alpha-1,2-fucosyltransferase, partial [Lachnospiraceae bacterium]|nr:alpha-1,2-fucosyltransferase [Lachnospiraceae bacterium]